MKKKKKWIIAGCVIAAVVILVLVGLNNLKVQAAQANTAVQTKALQKMTLADTVNVTGTVQSHVNNKVYSQVATLAVKTVNVSVGDTVNAGDVLCVLNTDSLEKQIEQSQATLDTAKSSGQQSVKSNQLKYNNDVANVQNGQNTTINQAKAAVDTAQTQLSVAENQYNQLVQAENNAKAALDANTDPTKTVTLQAAYDTAKNAEVTYSSTYNGAQKSYNNAVASLQAAQNAVNQQLQTEKQAITSSQAAANTGAQEAALEALQLQLSEATIKAPVSGTVTAVNAVAGAMSSGVLFSIDDTNDLEIATTIKEYDVNNVKLGMNCSIQSDGTGDDTYQGTLKSIDPAAVQSSTSSVAGTGAQAASGSNDITFNAIVGVTSKDTKLKIGMNARVSIILGQKENVLAVPYDAVVTNTAGEKVVYVQNRDASGKSSYQEIPVTTGMETDFYIEVSGKSLQEGMQIVSNPDSIPELKLKKALASAAASASSPAAAPASATASATGSK